MTFINGTITATANPGPALYAVIEPTLLAVGFTMVDTVVIGAATHKILKCAAGNNAFGLDWYLNIYYPTTGISSFGFGFRAFEYYDPATDLGYRGPAYFNSGSVPASDFTVFGTTGFALDDFNWQQVFNYMLLTTSNFNYQFSITVDRMFGTTSNNGFRLNYAGFYTPSAAFTAAAGAYMYPLISGYCGGYNDGNNPNFTLNRMPLPGVDVNRYLDSTDLGNSTSANPCIPAEEYDMIGVNFPFTGSLTAFQKFLAWELEIFIPNVGYIGKLLDVCQCRGNSSGLSFGDTATITPNADMSGGSTYVTTSAGNPLYFLKQV